MAKPNQNKGQQEKPVVSKHFSTVDFPLKQNVSPHGRVTAVSMMKDEGPFVLEWIAHHLAIGFTDLLVFTNDCSDGTDDMLFRLEQLGLAHHRVNDIPEGIRPQPSALKYAQQDPLVCASDWVLVFDADEFLSIRHDSGTMDGMISSAKQVGANGIVVTWRIFGSGGIHKWSRAPVTEQYLYAAPPMWNKGWGVKTLFQFDPDCWNLGIHRPKIKNKQLNTGFPETVKWLNGSGKPMEDYFKFRGWRSIARTVGYDWAQMNHYAVKSIDSYAIRKFRGNVNLKKDKYNSDYWALQDRNEVFDDGILRHAQRRNEIFEQLLTDPVLNRLHYAAVEGVEARLAEFRETPAYLELVNGLVEASKVPITQVEAKPPKARDPAKIAALMSEVEKKINDKSKSERSAKSHPDRDNAGNIYLCEANRKVSTVDMEVFENHGIKIPADPGIFTPVALQRIVDGKFERNTARKLPKLIKQGASYLEIGAGVGFLAAIIAKEIPSVSIMAHEESKPLLKTAVHILDLNKLETGPNFKQSNLPLFDTKDRTSSVEKLQQMIGESRCDVLVISDPRIDAGILADALSKVENRPKTVLISARALAGQMKASPVKKALEPLGFTSDTESPLSSALLMARKAT